MSKQKEGGISWTEETWNPLRGCSRISKGCMNCYAEGIAYRFGGDGQPYAGLIASTGQWNGKVRFVREKLLEPMNWKRPRLIFVNSMSDIFHEAVPDWQIDQIFAVMGCAYWHTFQVLTKRAERMHKYFSGDWVNRVHQAAEHIGIKPCGLKLTGGLPNVWLGVSVENQETANERIPYLLQTPAAVRWISAEPLLDMIDLKQAHISKIKLGNWPEPTRIDWCVVGGESGANARPMNPNWAIKLRDQCIGNGIPFHFKQWGEWFPRDQMDDDQKAATFQHKWLSMDGTASGTVRVGKKSSGRLLDGETWNEYPIGYETDNLE